jgi:hypothetical protein
MGVSSKKYFPKMFSVFYASQPRCNRFEIVRENIFLIFENCAKIGACPVKMHFHVALVSLTRRTSHSKHRHGLPICVVDFETEVYGANNTEQIKLSLSLGDWSYMTLKRISD